MIIVILFIMMLNSKIKAENISRIVDSIFENSNKIKIVKKNLEMTLLEKKKLIASNGNLIILKILNFFHFSHFLT